MAVLGPILSRLELEIVRPRMLSEWVDRFIEVAGTTITLADTAGTPEESKNIEPVTETETNDSPLRRVMKQELAKRNAARLPISGDVRQALRGIGTCAVNHANGQSSSQNTAEQVATHWQNMRAALSINSDQLRELAEIMGFEFNMFVRIAREDLTEHLARKRTPNSGGGRPPSSPPGGDEPTMRVVSYHSKVEQIKHEQSQQRSESSDYTPSGLVQSPELLEFIFGAKDNGDTIVWLRGTDNQLTEVTPRAGNSQNLIFPNNRQDAINSRNMF